MIKLSIHLKTLRTLVAAISVHFVGCCMAQNPIIQTRFTADPAPCVTEDTLYLVASVDNEEGEGYQKTYWQLYRTIDMVNWTDCGTIASLDNYTWAGDNGAWAPQMIQRNKRWYLYTPLQLRGIGVLTASTPYGPYRDILKKPLINQDIRDIDPTVFIDDDDQAYLYWGNGGFWCAKLSKGMMSIVGNIIEFPLTEESVGGYKEKYLDDKGVEQTRIIGNDCYEEGPWVYKRNGMYYLIYAAGGIPEHLSYSMSDSPVGPWKYKGRITGTPEGSFTTHPGIVDFKGKSYLFYHSGQLKGGNGFRRSICVEQFSYNDDGTIPYIEMTKRGVTEPVDHLSAFQRQEASTIAMSYGVRTSQNDFQGVFLDSLDHSDYVKVKAVDFGDKGAQSIVVNVKHHTHAGFIQVCMDSQSNVIASIPTDEALDWTGLRADLNQTVTGIHDIYFRFRAVDIEQRNDLMQFDYWQFDEQSITAIEKCKAVLDESSNEPRFTSSGIRISSGDVKGLVISKGKKQIIKK